MSFLTSGPQDGCKAFVVAVCASIIQAMTFGVSNSFPNFVGAMMGDEDLGNPTSQTLSLVQAVALGLSAVLSVPAGLVVDRFGPRLANIISFIGLVLGCLLPAFAANSGESMIGLYSVPMGIAMGFMMSTGATATSTWFDKRAALGMGICFTGGGTGSLSVPRIAGALASSFTWRKSFMILSALGGLQAIATIFVCIRPAADEADEKLKVMEEGHRSTDSIPTRGSDQDNENVSPAITVPTVVSPAEPGARYLEEIHPNTLSKEGKRFNYHTEKATIKQLIFECLLTRNFIGLFCSYAFFSLGFYGFLYVAVPYPLSMGTGPYAGAPSINIDSASNVFVPFGICQTLGGPINGFIATNSDPRLVFIGSMGILTVTVAYYAICRTIVEFLVVCSILGYGISGFFSTFGTMIAQRYWGPNLSIIMSLGFSGAAFGGFLGSTLSTAITDGQNGDYTYATVMYSLAFFMAGVMVMFVVTSVEESDAHLTEVEGAISSKETTALLSRPMGDDREMLIFPAIAGCPTERDEANVSNSANPNENSAASRLASSFSPAKRDVGKPQPLSQHALSPAGSPNSGTTHGGANSISVPEMAGSQNRTQNADGAFADVGASHGLHDPSGSGPATTESKATAAVGAGAAPPNNADMEAADDNPLSGGDHMNGSTIRKGTWVDSGEQSPDGDGKLCADPRSLYSPTSDPDAVKTMTPATSGATSRLMSPAPEERM